MSNDKVAATFHGEKSRVTVEFEPGDPGMDDVLMAQATSRKPPAADPTPEQALRAHVADLLTDVDHFAGCKANEDCDCTCICLIGRLHWAVNAEQVTEATDPTQTAIGVIARSVTEQMLGDAGQEIGDLWGDYPEIGESDWEAVVSLVMWRARNGKPDEATHREAYEHLKGRAETAQDGAA